MKPKYKIGDKLDILEFCRADTRYVKVEIIKIYDKNLYNMYLCKNIVTGTRITFTEKDLNEKSRKRNKIRR